MSEDQPRTEIPDQAQQIEDAVRPEAHSFPYVYTQESFAPPEGADVTEFEKTPEGYLELEWQYRDAQRALALDFDHFASAAYTRPQLEDLAQSKLEQLNAQRGELDQPAEAVNLSEANGRFLGHLIRPVWQDKLPEDQSKESIDDWERFKAQYPEHMQINLEELRELDGKMRVLSNDQVLQEAVHEIHAERIEVMRAASSFIGADRKIDALTRRVAEIYRGAGVSNRPLTRGEQRHVDRLQAQQSQVRAERGKQITTPEMLAQVKTELRRRIDIDRRRDFERGLVMTDSMRQIIDELLPSLAQGRPALLVGETGGAKTALAEYISRQYFGKEPEFISGYGDINSYQVMGKQGLETNTGELSLDTVRTEIAKADIEWDSLSEDKKADLVLGILSVSSGAGSPESVFTPGPVIRAMEEGRPLILDEINAMPPEFLKRLNKIVQLKPGDNFVVQEDSGREVQIRPGFVIIATANEKSKRYKGVEDLSVEFQNRFGANVIRIHYPDHDIVFGQPPVENAVIARAALTDRAGGLTGGIDAATLERFVKACHVTQQVFTGNFGNGFKDYVTSERIADGKPGLEEAVLAPRTMVALLEKVRDSHGQVSLDQVIERFVSGVKSENDRKTMTTILQGYGFLSGDK